MIESLWKGVPLSELSHAQLVQVIESMGKQNRQLRDLLHDVNSRVIIMPALSERIRDALEREG